MSNMIAAIKFAKYNELTEDDYIASIATDYMPIWSVDFLRDKHWLGDQLIDYMKTVFQEISFTQNNLTTYRDDL